MTVNPSYGTPPTPPPPPEPAKYGPQFAFASSSLDPVKAHAAYCAALVLQGEAQRTMVSEHDAKQMARAFEEFLREKR